MARFSVEAVFKAVDRVTAPVSRMQGRMQKFTRAASAGLNRANRSFKTFGQSVKRTAAGMAVAVALMAAPMASLARTGADFEQAITDVGAVGLQTRDQIKPLEDMALRLGKTTKFTSTQAARAMETMAKAGFTTSQILAGVPGVLSAAAASGLEIEEVANHVSNALKGMGLEADQAGRVADVLALASARTNSTIGTLGESLKNVASTARQLRVPFEDTVAAVALLQDVGLDASVAGSAMNTMLTKMAKPPAAVAAQMKKFGVSFKDAKGNMLPFQEVIQNISKAAQKSGGNMDRVAFLADLVGLRGQKAAANLADLFETGKLEKLTKELENANGSAEKMAKLKMDTVTGSFTLLQSAIDGVKVRIFGMNEGPLKDMIDRMTAWVSANEALIATRIGDFIADMIANVDTLVSSVKAFGVAALSFMALGKIIEIATGAMWLFNAAAAANPITWIVLGITALIGILTLLIETLGRVSGAFSILPDWAVPDSLLGLGEDDEFDMGGSQNAQGRPQVVSPQDSIARTIQESSTMNQSEVTITAGEGTKAEVTRGRLGGGLKLQQSGAF